MSEKISDLPVKDVIANALDEAALKIASSINPTKETPYLCFEVEFLGTMFKCCYDRDGNRTSCS